MPSAGDYVRASDTTRYYCKATQGSTQSLSSGTFTAITFGDADSVDTLGMHDPVTNNSQFTIGLKLGWWIVQGVVAWANSTASWRFGARVDLNGTGVNGSEIYSQSSAVAGLAITTTTFTLVQSTVSTDYVQIMGSQASGGNLSTAVSTAHRCSANLYYLGT